MRTLLETLIGSDDNAKVGAIKPFLELPLERVKACLGHKQEKKVNAEYPEFKSFIQVWDEYYHYVGLQMPKDGKRIKSLIEQTRMQIRNRGGIADSEKTINFWRALVQNLYRTWCHGKNLSTIDSQFNALVFELANGKKRNGPQSTRERINSL
jgi:hypothetical protein